MKVKVLVAQSCPTLFDPMDCSLADSSVHGIFQANILEQVAIPFSRGSSQPRGQTQVCCTVSNSLSSEPRRNMLRCKLIKLKKIKYKEKDWNQQENFPCGTLNKNLPTMQGTWVQGARVWSPVQEDSTCCGETKPMHHNWAQALEPTRHNYWALMPQLLKFMCLESVFHNKRSHLNEKPVHCNTE